MISLPAASNFVNFDNFHVIEKEIPVNYAGRRLNNDSEGTNRNLNVGVPIIAERDADDPLTGTDRDLLPGNANVAAPDSDDGEQSQGYLWNGALKAKLARHEWAQHTCM